jgi:hypothetical protein
VVATDRSSGPPPIVVQNPTSLHAQHDYGLSQRCHLTVLQSIPLGAGLPAVPARPEPQAPGRGMATPYAGAQAAAQCPLSWRRLGRHAHPGPLQPELLHSEASWHCPPAQGSDPWSHIRHFSTTELLKRHVLVSMRAMSSKSMDSIGHGVYSQRR